MREIDIGDNNISNEFTMNIASSEYVDFLGNPRVVEVVPYEDRFENYNSGDLRIYVDYHKIIHDISCNDYMIVNEENISKNEL